MAKGIHQLLAGKWEDGTRPKDVYALYVSKTPEVYLDAIIRGLQSPEARVRAGCAELASFLSEDQPALLYPFVDLFLANLDSKEPVARWEAVCTLGNLAVVDEQHKVSAAAKRIIPNLRDKSIVLQVHAVRALGRIARTNPDKGADIFNALVTAADAFPGNRIGFVIEAMEYFLEAKPLLPKVRVFVEPYLNSDVSIVVTKAKKMLKSLPSA
jgi:hypothetical protein